MKYYLVKQINAIGNGYSTTIELVTDPKIENGGIRATKVGEIDYTRFDVNRPIFEEIEPREFIICGNVTCEEYANPFGK